jgi:hypothetical protein
LFALLVEKPATVKILLIRMKGVKVNMDKFKPLIWAILITAIVSTMDWNSYLSN